MGYRDLLVYVDEGRACESRIDYAVRMARAFEAHLTGLYVDPGLVIPAVVDAPISPELVERLEQDRADAISAAEGLFGRVAQSSDLSTEWRTARGELVSTLALHTRHSDLVVVGQEGGGEEGTIVLGGLPDALVMTCGRPVLIVPYIGAPETVGTRVLLGWDGGREAVRALHDALPLLQRAEVVEVVSVNPDQREEPGTRRLPGADICAHLARHGVNAEAQTVVANDIDVGNLLLSRASDVAADLIVMGAYGHSRWREIVLGGATRDLLQHMTVPLLMSH